MLVHRQGFDSEHSQQLQAAGKGMVRVLNATTQTVPLASITRLLPPRPVLKDRIWEGNLDAKLDMKRNENEVDEWKLKGNTRTEHGRWRHLLVGELERELKNGNEVKDNWHLAYDLDRFLGEHWFWRTGVAQWEDELGQIKRERIVGTGPGYRFGDNELGRFDLVSQFSRVRFETAEDDLEFDTYLLGWDYKRLLWGTRLELYSNAGLQLPVIEEIDYVLDSEVGLRYRLNDWARLSLLYELDQVRGLGQATSERRYLLGIGMGR